MFGMILLSGIISLTLLATRLPIVIKGFGVPNVVCLDALIDANTRHAAPRLTLVLRSVFMFSENPEFAFKNKKLNKKKKLK